MKVRTQNGFGFAVKIQAVFVSQTKTCSYTMATAICPLHKNLSSYVWSKTKRSRAMVAGTSSVLKESTHVRFGIREIYS